MTEPETDPRQMLFTALRDLRLEAGAPTLREIADRSGGGVSHSSVSRVFRGEVLPRFGLVEAIVTALGGDVEPFRVLHQRALDATRDPRWESFKTELDGRFVVTVDCPGSLGVPLSFASWFMLTIAEALPNTVLADATNGAPLALAISWDDLRALDDLEPTDEL